jgi:myosin heavy subunit
MSEIMTREQTGLKALDRLAAEARFYSESAAMSILQLGRVLTEAKPQLEHGAWAGWVKENTDMSLRSAQMCMQAYRRYGNNAAFAGIDRSKLFKLMALPEGQDARFVEEHDVNSMTAREVEEAVKRAKAEAEAEIRQEREARRQAEQRAYEAEHRPPEIPEDVAKELEFQRKRVREEQANAQHFAELARKAGSEQAKMARENKRLQEDMERQQADYDQLNTEFLAMRNAQRRGDVDRGPSDELTYEVFSGAVREFMGLCARMPYMGPTFSNMPQGEKQRYAQCLETIEGWTRGARQALDASAMEGVILDV